MTWQDLTPEDAHAALEADPSLRVLDVRTIEEHRRHRLANATLMPIQEITDRFEELDPKAPWLVYCEHGLRSVAACQFLAAQGFEDLRNLRGGMAYWVGCGLPVEE